jgi:hypothetical protein
LSEKENLDGLINEDRPREGWHDAYHVPPNKYWIANAPDAWVVLNEAGMIRELKAQGLRASLSEDELKAGVRLHEVDRALREIQQTRVLDYCGLLAGYKAGFYRLNGRRVLVTHSMDLGEECTDSFCWTDERLQKLVDGFYKSDQAAALKWVDKLRELSIELGESPNEDAARFPILWRFFENLFARDEHDQRHLVWGIVAGTCKALHRGCGDQDLPPQAPALFIAGEPGAGKTLLSEIIRQLYGKRRAFPYEYLTGGTAFNEELFEATLQLIDDEADRTDIKSRSNLAQKLKQFTVGAGNRVHGKGAKALESTPLWRVLMLCNVDEDSLRVLPPMDMTGDKVVLLKAHGRSVPLPTGTELQKAILWRAITEEIKFFRYWLRTIYELPDEYGPTSRFPVKPWHHPEIIELMEETAPWFHTWDLLCRTLMRHGMDQYKGKRLPDYCFVGTSQTVVETLRDGREDYKLTQREVDSLKPHVVGKHLKQIAAKRDGKAVQIREGKQQERVWWLSKNGDFKNKIEPRR